MRVLGRAEWNRPLGGGSGGIEGSERQRESSKVAVEGGRTSCGESIEGRHRGGRKEREMRVLGRVEWNRPSGGGSGGVEGSQRQRESSKVAVEGGRIAG